MNDIHFEGSQEKEMSQGEALKSQIAQIDAKILSIAEKVGAMNSPNHPDVENYNQEVQNLEMERVRLVNMLQNLI